MLGYCRVGDGWKKVEELFILFFLVMEGVDGMDIYRYCIFCVFKSMIWLKINN